MKLYIILLTALVMGAGCSQMKKTTKTDYSGQGLRFDGLYYKEGLITPNSDRRDNFTYLRFYPDGTVLRQPSASNPEQATRFMTKRRVIGGNQTSYKLKKDNLTFTVKNGSNYLTHEGTVRQDTLEFNVYGSENEGNYITRFTFIKLDLQDE